MQEDSVPSYNSLAKKSFWSGWKFKLPAFAVLISLIVPGYYYKPWLSLFGTESTASITKVGFVNRHKFDSIVAEVKSSNHVSTTIISHELRNKILKSNSAIIAQTHNSQCSSLIMTTQREDFKEECLSKADYQKIVGIDASSLDSNPNLFNYMLALAQPYSTPIRYNSSNPNHFVLMEDADFLGINTHDWILILMFSTVAVINCWSEAIGRWTKQKWLAAKNLLIKRSDSI